ncbi:MAG: NAD(P)-binding domain-containing protein [Gammaproteobacteria bacterium]|nr:NAD(P)-binding domain-containing protein [Gammaproteobacteria bacterium]
MKILFADKFPDAYMQELVQRGHECTYQPNLTADDLAAAVPGHEALVVRSTKVNADTIGAGSDLKLVIRAGAGTNTIDKAVAAENGVSVCNVPGKNAVAVAELVMGLLLAIDRRIPDNVAELRDGKWNKKTYSEAQGLYGRKMGVVGLGAIGLAVVERARAFGIDIIVIRKSGRSAELQKQLNDLGVQYVDDLGTLVESCDIISLHVPASDDTKGMVNQEFLAKLKPDSILLNASRGDVIDESALVAAMGKKGIRAGLDVYADEPGSGQADFDSVLAKHPNVYGTHHIGASTTQAQNAVAEGVIEIVDAYVDGTVLNCVNGVG